MAPRQGGFEPCGRLYSPDTTRQRPTSLNTLVAMVSDMAVTVRRRVAVAIGLATSVCIVSPANASHQPNPFATGETLVIPHGGGDGLFPENTIVAWERSAALIGTKATMVIDVDVRLAADGVPVAIHDPTVDRTTRTSGLVSDMTSAQLATLDAGYRFKANGTYPFRGKGHGVPTVASVLKRFPGRLTTLDLKDQRKELVAPLCKLLTDLGRTDTVYVGIDVDVQVLEFRKRCPTARTSGTSEDRSRSRAACEAADPSFESHQLVSQPEHTRVTATSLAWSHSHGTAVLTYVVDDPATMDALIDLGVDGIYTRRPDRLLARITAHRRGRS